MRRGVCWNRKGIRLIWEGLESYRSENIYGIKMQNTNRGLHRSTIKKSGGFDRLEDLKENIFRSTFEVNDLKY